MYRGQISAWRTPTRGIERPAFVYIMCTCTYIYIRFGADAKKGVHPQNFLTKRGTLLFVDREVFDVHVVVGINPTAQQDVCASTVHYVPYIHHHSIRIAKRPPACGTSTLHSKKPDVRTGNIADLRTASVCFIREEPQYIPCILNGRGRIQVIGACPVTRTAL